MRLSDLLGARVFDAAGADLGPVLDVRAIQDGPMVDGFGALLRIDGLVVGRGALGVRLGFHRSRVKGPWPIKRPFEALERRALYVPWDRVTAWEEGRLTVSARRSELGESPPLER